MEHIIDPVSNLIKKMSKPSIKLCEHALLKFLNLNLSKFMLSLATKFSFPLATKSRIGLLLPQDAVDAQSWPAPVSYYNEFYNGIDFRNSLLFKIGIC